MRTLFVSLVVIFFAFLIGCQESSITDPVFNDTGWNLGTVDKNIINSYPGDIKLDGSVYDPSHRLNSFAEIKGILRYKLEKIYTDSRPPRPAYKVKLYTNAELKTNCPKSDHLWTVNKTSEDVIYISTSIQPFFFLEKSFKVENTCCRPLDLILKFRVSEKQVQLISTRLFINEY